MISTAQLIREVSKESEYNIYEVEDIITALTKVIANKMLEGEAIKFEHLFIISPKVNAPRNYMDATALKLRVSTGSVSAKIKLAAYLKQKLNAHIPKRTLAEEENA